MHKILRRLWRSSDGSMYPTHFIPPRVQIIRRVGIPMWSICLSHVWHLDLLSATVVIVYSGYTGIRFCSISLSTTTSDPVNSIVFGSAYTTCFLLTHIYAWRPAASGASHRPTVPSFI
ncbi:hypothetical protein L210DRAFT_2447886 [Boletus edulis BED1]|uniref:Uncharacterized protein n=1 Tax=Boletus edulis BED1 TaxID=1328754 RepID=A0AAD4G601_BOLED|nr:hypothetical protein L210DRAFT_2447886 [Boletus edulis BED1]